MKILIVDDIDNNRIAIELLLEDFDGIETFEACDGQEAIEMCRETHFDIIFMDVMMPNIDGISATREIKSFDSKVMILAVSALDDMDSKNKMLANGAEDYITKPIQDELFLKRVKNYLQIVEYRNSKLSNDDAVNAFTQEIYSRSLKFSIKSLQSLSEFWDYYLNEASYDIDSLEDCIRIIYAYGQICLNAKNNFVITAEENETDLFLTLSPLNVLSDMVIKNTLLKNYSNAIFILKDSILSFRLAKAKHTSDSQSSSSQSPIEESEKSYQDQILSKTHFNKTTALEYVESTAISLMDKIEELEIIEDKMDNATMIFEMQKDKEALQAITEGMDSYLTVLDQLMEFEHLAFGLTTLNNFLKTLDPTVVDETTHKKFIILFVHLIEDISQWRKNIFILQEANDIHYLDSSLLSSCLQLQALFEEKNDEQEDEDDFELF